MNEDDDFWTTYIATTPEQDKEFGCGWIGVAVIVFGIIVWLLL